jgi:hypothetical protein
MLVIEGYLWEDMVVTRDQMATAYLRLGAKAQLLLQVPNIASSYPGFPCSFLFENKTKNFYFPSLYIHC